MVNISELGIRQEAQASRVSRRKAIVVFSTDIQRLEGIAESPLVDDNTREASQKDLKSLLEEIPSVHHNALRSGEMIKIGRDYTGGYDWVTKK